MVWLILIVLLIATLALGLFDHAAGKISAATSRQSKPSAVAWCAISPSNGEIAAAGLTAHARAAFLVAAATLAAAAAVGFFTFGREPRRIGG